MLIPVRCFTCNKVIGHLWNKYNEMVAEYSATGLKDNVARSRTFEDLGVSQYCCKRMLLTHVNIIDGLLLYSNNPGEKTPSSYPETVDKDGDDEEEQVDKDGDDEEEYCHTCGVNSSESTLVTCEACDAVRCETNCCGMLFDEEDGCHYCEDCVE